MDDTLKEGKKKEKRRIVDAKKERKKERIMDDIIKEGKK